MMLEVTCFISRWISAGTNLNSINIVCLCVCECVHSYLTAFFFHCFKFVPVIMYISHLTFVNVHKKLVFPYETPMIIFVHHTAVMLILQQLFYQIMF